MVELVAAQYPELRKDVARGRAMAVISTMVGALAMSRIVTDPKLSAAILNNARRQLING